MGMGTGKAFLSPPGRERLSRSAERPLGDLRAGSATATESTIGADAYDRLADQLAREFEAPVGLFDPVRGEWRSRRGEAPESFPSARPDLAQAIEAGVVPTDRVTLWSPSRGDGPAWLVVPIPGPGGGDLVALAGFASHPALVEAGRWGPAGPERALCAWGRVVAEGLRAEALRRRPGSSSGLEARERPLPDRLMRKLRVSDGPEVYQRLVATAVREALNVAAVAWVPSHPREPVVVAGTIEGLTAEAYRTLIPTAPDETIRIVNQPGSRRSALVERYAVAAADAGAPAGWLVAVNPRDGRFFDPSAIELLQPAATLIGVQRGNARLYADLKDLLFGVIRALTAAIDAKDPYTSGHSERVARIAVRLGQALGMSSNQRGDLYLMGLLHDVGKIGVEDSVLKKGGKLTPEEFRQIQAHVRIGVQILSDLKKLHHLLPGVAHHHESLDGSGYPSGLAGDEIPLEARILAVADAFDAMSSNRPYRQRLSSAQIDENFRKGAGVQWDARVVEALFTCRAELDRISQKGLGESLKQVVDDTLGRS